MKQGIDLKDAIDALTDLIIGKKTKSSVQVVVPNGPLTTL